MTVDRVEVCRLLPGGHYRRDRDADRLLHQGKLRWVRKRLDVGIVLKPERIVLIPQDRDAEHQLAFASSFFRCPVAKLGCNLKHPCPLQFVLRVGSVLSVRKGAGEGQGLAGDEFHQHVTGLLRVDNPVVRRHGQPAINNSDAGSRSTGSYRRRSSRTLGRTSLRKVTTSGSSSAIVASSRSTRWQKKRHHSGMRGS